MKPLLPIVLCVIAFSGCKDRGVSRSLETSAIAAPSELLTQDGQKRYPSQKMLLAAQNAVNKALQAQAAADADGVRKALSILRLNIRMRPTRQAPAANTPNGMVTCTLTSSASPNQRISASQSATNTDGNAYASSNDGLDVTYQEDGETIEENYSFDMQVIEGDLNVTFYENVNAQDEVGGFGCSVATARGQRFCEEPIDGSGRRIGIFACVLD